MSIRPTTLRQRVRKSGICPQPWKHYKGEIQRLPISAQTLFKNKGLPCDVLEIELRIEGWLSEDESLWDVINELSGLKRSLIIPDTNTDPWDDTWTEEDFIYFYEYNNDRSRVYG